MPPIPRPSRRTLNEFVFQIITIIAGILIALWVDNIVEARREQSLVRDAHAAIAREIADNLKSLTESLPALDRHERHLKSALQFADDLRKQGKTAISSIELTLSMPSLNRASWQSAERTGALGYMDFGDVQAYAEIYDLQDFVVQRQYEQLTRIADVMSRLYGGEDGDPMKMRPPELEAFRSRVLDALGALTIHKSLVEGLVKAYQRAPKR
jgi:hypothetical protein